MIKGKGRTREQIVLLAKMAQETERYEDLLGFVKELIVSPYDLSNEERSLFSSAFKIVVGNHRAELRVLAAARLEEEKKRSRWGLMAIERYRGVIEEETIGRCREVLRMVEEQLLPNVKTIESKVFFLKMKGDYLRYMCEFLAEEELEENIQEAKRTYYQGESYARNNLTSTNPVRLGLMLNLSVLYHEVEGRPERALEIANKAFDEAVANIDNVNEESYKECTLILQLLRDNITLWNSEIQQA